MRVFKLLVLLLPTLAAGSALQAQVAYPGPPLTAEEVDSFTLTPEEYEEKYGEEFDEDVPNDDPDWQGETCGLGSNTPEAKEFMRRILGPWQISHLAGFVVAGGMTLPFPPAGDNETITFQKVGKTLIATHPEAPEPMVFGWPRENNWRWVARDDDALFPVPGMSSEDVEMFQNCEIQDMPRMIGKTQVVVDGIVMNFTYRLVVTNDKIMHGIMHFTGIAQGMVITSTRTVVLTR